MQTSINPPFSIINQSEATEHLSDGTYPELDAHVALIELILSLLAMSFKPCRVFSSGLWQLILMLYYNLSSDFSPRVIRLLQVLLLRPARHSRPPTRYDEGAVRSDAWTVLREIQVQPIPLSRIIGGNGDGKMSMDFGYCREFYITR